MPTEKGKRNPSITGRLKEKVTLRKDELFKTLSLCKQQRNRFYAVFTVERCSKQEMEHKEAMSLYRKQCHLAKKENHKEKPKKPEIQEEKGVIPDHVKWIALDPAPLLFLLELILKGIRLSLKNYK